VCAPHGDWGPRRRKIAMKKKSRKPDPFTAPELVGSEVAEAIYHALRPLDATATAMEDKWGVDRLPSLVGVDMAARFGAAKAKLDVAIAANDAAEVTKRAGVLLRGWQAMDAEAEQAGAKPMSVSAWTWRDDSDQPHAFVRDEAEARAYAKANPGVSVWSIGEVVRVAAMFDRETQKIGTAAKAVFPAATVQGRLDDDIPF